MEHSGTAIHDAAIRARLEAAGPAAAFLVCRSGRSYCALPRAHVTETMRPLPVEILTDMPEFLLGLATIRGDIVPVIHLGKLFGPGAANTPGRYVTLTIDGHSVAAAVDEVLGLYDLASATQAGCPPLLQEVGHGALTTIATLDNALLLVLQGARLLPDAVWDSINTLRSPS